MQLVLSKARFPLIALGLLALLTALWSGLVRLGWALPLVHPLFPAVHGPLMVCGFLGTLIDVERAVALGAGWPYAAPLLTAVGALALLTGLPAPPLMTLGSLGLVAIFAVIVRRQCALATVTIPCGRGPAGLVARPPVGWIAECSRCAPFLDHAGTWIAAREAVLDAAVTGSLGTHMPPDVQEHREGRPRLRGVS